MLVLGHEDHLRSLQDLVNAETHQQHKIMGFPGEIEVLYLRLERSAVREFQPDPISLSNIQLPSPRFRDCRQQERPPILEDACDFNREEMDIRHCHASLPLRVIPLALLSHESITRPGRTCRNRLWSPMVAMAIVEHAGSGGDRTVVAAPMPGDLPEPAT